MSTQDIARTLEAAAAEQQRIRAEIQQRRSMEAAPQPPSRTASAPPCTKSVQTSTSAYDTCDPGVYVGGFLPNTRAELIVEELRRLMEAHRMLHQMDGQPYCRIPRGK
eukprot:2630631-Alexandrium_andersonii.AAC.1